MSLLDGPRLKLSIAHDDIKLLDATLTGVINDRNVYAVETNRDPNSGQFVDKARVTKPTDPVWGVRVGCIAHVLRSTLDNLTYGLAILITTTPYDKVGFPIFMHPEGFKERAYFLNKRGKPAGMIRDLNPAHRAAIEAAQPYQAANGGLTDPLWLLHEMNNADKHRTLHLTVMGVASLTTLVRFNAADEGGDHLNIAQRIMFPRGVHFIDGAELAKGRREVGVKTHYALHVCFDTGCAAIAQLPVIETLHRIEKRVKSIVELFA